MDLNALKLFVEIVDAGNLSAAARRLQTTRSNVSHRLKAFERALGVQLLRRTTRRVEPTEVGAGIYEHGRSILREMAAADALVSSLGKSLQGSVRLSVPTGLGHLLVSPLLVAFKRAYPDIRLDVRFDNRVSDLIGEDVDVALRIVSNPPESLVATLLDEVDWVLCAAPDYLAVHGVPKTLDALAGHTIVSAPAVGQPLRLSAQAGRNARSSRWIRASRPTTTCSCKRPCAPATGWASCLTTPRPTICATGTSSACCPAIGSASSAAGCTCWRCRAGIGRWRRGTCWISSRRGCRASCRGCPRRRVPDQASNGISPGNCAKQIALAVSMKSCANGACA